MAETIAKQDGHDAMSFRQCFERARNDTPQPPWLARLREAGLSSFEQQGFPTLKDEDWRFTNVAPIANLPFQPALGLPDGDGISGRVAQIPFTLLDGPRLVFVNGHFSREHSTLHNSPPGVRIENLAAALAADSSLLEKHLGQYAHLDGNSFAALNQAMFADGAFLRVPAGVDVVKPIEFIFVSSARHPGETCHPRNLVIAEAGSRVTIVESYVGAHDTRYFTNAVTELVVGDSATVELLKFQDETPNAFHVATIQGKFGRASNVTVHSFALGARLSRNNIRAHLAGEGLECVLNGLYLTKGEQLADHHMVVEHAQPRCASHEYFNGILDDSSKGVFHGRILVRPIAQKTDAKQTNKNLLLSDDATADTKPQLEIYADDVKCTHGATIGQLNDESIFYLRSRGLSVETAKRMLIHAFAGEIIARIHSEPVREELDQVLWDRLEANPHIAEKQ
jgi:Fe-S cluster assembly protein SufD